MRNALMYSLHQASWQWSPRKAEAAHDAIGLDAAKKGHPLAGRSQGQKKYVANSCVNSQSQQRATFIRADTNRARFLTGWLRTESHQTPVGIKPVAMLRDCPGGSCRPRETLVPGRVQGVVCIPRGYRHDDDASPLMAHGLGDSAFCIRSDGARAASKSFGWLHTSPFSWLAAPGQTVTRNTGAHRRASGLEARGSTPAQACVREP